MVFDPLFGGRDPRFDQMHIAPVSVIGRQSDGDCRSPEIAKDETAGRFLLHDLNRQMLSFDEPEIETACRGARSLGPETRSPRIRRPCVEHLPRGALAMKPPLRSEEHTSELPSLMLIAYAAFC